VGRGRASRSTVYGATLVTPKRQVRLCDACAAADETGGASPEAAGLLADWADGAADQRAGWSTSSLQNTLLAICHQLMMAS
jgi:hypothetical protein